MLQLQARALKCTTTLKFQRFTKFGIGQIKADEPGKTLLYFTKGDITRRFFFKDEDRDRVFDVAKKHNKKIKIYDAYEYKENLKSFKKELKKTKRSWQR